MEKCEEVLLMPDGKRHPFHRLGNGEITRQEAAAEMSQYHGLGKEALVWVRENAKLGVD